MKKFFSIILLLQLVSVAGIMAQDEYSTTINPKAQILVDGLLTDTTSYEGSAPLQVTFVSNTSNPYGYDAHLAWYICKQSSKLDAQPDTIIRYEDETEFTFNEAGAYTIYLTATFREGDNIVQEYTLDSYNDNSLTPITIKIQDSKLTFPNAFSPNGDGVNDTFTAKECQSIIEFHASIYNRWGQKLYEWTDPSGEWDGRFHGHVVRDGVYFAYIKAKGSDGTVYKIKTDVNVLTGFTPKGSSTSDN